MTDTPKNVIIITIDSLRADHLPTFGYETENTESISSLAKESLSFSNAFATGPGTTPSFPALLTGTLPLSYGGLGPLDSERPRVATKLSEEGLSTGAFQCNPFLSSYFNYNTGFDCFKDYQNALMGIATKIFPRGIEINNPKFRRVDEWIHLTDALKKSYQLIKGKPRPYVNAEVITTDTINWLKKTNNQFFCWTHYMDVHHPCFPPISYREKYRVSNVTQSEVSEWYSALLRNPTKLSNEEIEELKRLYDASIDYTDDQISRIIEYLKESGRYKDTLIIITSDHGELFGEYDQYGKPERMYDELLHIPLLVVNGPEYLFSVTDELTSLLDIPPLVHESLGFEVPEEYEGQVPGVDKTRDYIIAEHEVEGEVIIGARSRDWLYEGDEIRGDHRLIDLQNGGFEQVSHGSSPEAEKLEKVVLRRLNQLDIDTRRLEDEVEGDIQDRLKDLGYL